MPAPTRFFVVYRNAVPMRPEDEDGDLERFYSSRDFRTEAGARRFAARHPGATVNERAGMERTVPGYDDWTWTDREIT